MLVYTVSIIDSVFEAIPPVEAWLSSAQTLVHRVALSSLGIHQHLPRAVLYGGPKTLGFCVPLLFLRSKLRYLKGLFKGINSRSILTREIVRHVLDTPLPQPMRGDWDCVRAWLVEFELQLLPAASDLLAPASVEWVQDCAPVGSVLAVTDGSQDGAAHGWAVVLVDALGIFAWACSGTLLSCGSSWVAEWRAKSRAVWLLRPLSVAVSDVLGFVADNLAASFDLCGGKPSWCVWVDAVRLDYASFLTDGPVPEFFVPAQHDTLRVDLVASWQAEADRLAKAGLLLARPFTVPLPSLLSNLYLWLDGSHLVCDVVSALDTKYSGPCRAQSPNAGGFDTARWERCLSSGLLPNPALKFALWLRSAPFCHVSERLDFHCFICCSPCHSWGSHLYFDCVHTAVASFVGFHTLAGAVHKQVGTIAWSSVTQFSSQSGDVCILWTLVHPASPSSPPEMCADVVFD